MEDAVIALAGRYQFGPEQDMLQPRVESLMLIWCEEGGGEVEVNGQPRRYASGDWELLPWGRRIRYLADAHNPFLMGAIHLIPRHARDHPVQYEVPHHLGERLTGAPWRQDFPWTALAPELPRGIMTDSLRHLSAYIIAWFDADARTEPRARQLARLLLEDLVVLSTRGPATARPHSAIVRRVQTFVEKHPRERPSMPRLAEVSGCSVPSLYRAFQQAMGVSPSQWLARWKAQQAARLLRTSSLPVQQVALETGFHDPFHFSRFFKKEMGESPRRYRERQRSGFFS